MKIRKSIEFAYPTSINAKKLGFNETGCFHVDICRLFMVDGLWDSETLDPVKGYVCKHDPGLLAEYASAPGEDCNK